MKEKHNYIVYAAFVCINVSAVTTYSLYTFHLQGVNCVLNTYLCIIQNINLHVSKIHYLTIRIIFITHVI